MMRSILGYIVSSAAFRNRLCITGFREKLDRMGLRGQTKRAYPNFTCVAYWISESLCFSFSTQRVVNISSFSIQSGR